MTALQRPGDAGMDPQHFLRVGTWHAGIGCHPSVALLRLLGGDSAHKPCAVPDTGLRFTQLAHAERLLNTCLKHPCLVASSWLLVVLSVLGWSDGRAPLPRLCTPAGPLAQRSPPGGQVSCHISSPASPVHTEAYLGHELTCVWICLWS